MAEAKTIAPKEGPLVRFWEWLTETQAWKSVFRHDRPNTDRTRVLVMLSNVFLHFTRCGSASRALSFAIPGPWAG